VAGEPWAPTLSDVARHIPRRTRDTKTPGSDKLLGTFTASTTPTSDQAQAVIDAVVGTLLAGTGPLPAAGTAVMDIQTAARTAAEWRAAADIELAYPLRDADVQVYDQLNARAADALATLKQVLAQAGGGQVDVATPYWGFPAPPPWGDLSPGSGVEALPAGRGQTWEVPVWPA
jgi:hypothetical protein